MSVTAPATKRAKTSDEDADWLADHKMNVSKAVDKAFEDKTFGTIVAAKPSALEGLGEVADEILEAVHVKTVEDLATWKFGKIARAFVTLAELEEDGKRPPKSMLNADKALDAEHESKSFKEIIDLPVSALQGLPERVNEILKHHHIDTVGKLGKWRYLREAEALVTLAAFEETQSPSERRAAREAKKLKD